VILSRPPDRPAGSCGDDQPSQDHGGRQRAARAALRRHHPRAGRLLVAGIWAAVAPRSFARLVAFPYHEHFLHDLGAFQLGLGATLLLALAWRDAATVALVGFLVANTLHAVSHAVDLDQGGRASDPYAIGAVSLLAAAALVLRVRRGRSPVPVPDSRQAQP
jgi:hypothetical protein